MFLKRIFAVLILSSFVFLALNSGEARAISCDANVEGKSNSELQAILDQCDRDIAEQKAILSKTQKQSSDLEKGIAELTYKINTTQIEINARTAKIKQLGENITTKTQYIGVLSTRMENIKKSVSKMIRDTYNLNNISLIEIALSSQDLSDLFKDIDSYATIDKKLRELTSELTTTKKTSETEKKDLETRKAQEEKLKFEQDAEKRQLEVYKKEKQNILTATKGQESAYKKIIADKEKLKNQISNRLFRTVGGQELTFGEALKIIKPYESTIGVSSALVLAILTQETSVDGLIGKNIGKCYYNQSAKNTNGTVMSKTQIPSFLAIMSELGLNPDKTPVSCPIYADGEYGGAMGPAQFMPTTWWNIGTETGYKNRVGAVLGSSVPSPFNSRDAFVGTALYIKDAQTICKTAFTKKTDIWACSASKYYGGLSLKGSRLSTYMYGKYGYGKQVADRAVQFEKDIDTLSL
jgi:peptidoglycan hydrolase CwlO-like protein